MYDYDDEVLEYFLAHQQQLFSENVAETPEEAEEFLEDCMAVVCKNLKEVKDYFDEAGMDIAGMSDEDILRTIALYRLIMPTAYLRFAGGVARLSDETIVKAYKVGINAAIIGDMLTTAGRDISSTVERIRQAGYEF